MDDETYWQEFWVCNKCKHKIKFKDFKSKYIKIIDTRPVPVCQKCKSVGSMIRTRMRVIGERR